MIRSHRKRLLVLASAGALVLAACGSDDNSATDTTAATTETSAAEAADTTAAEAVDTTAVATEDTEAADTTEAPPSEGWTVNTDDCTDPDAANEPLGDTVKIGSVMALSGGLAAAAFAPVADGTRAYIDYANEQQLIPGVTLELVIEDDQYNKDLTPGAVDKLLDDGVSVITGIIGTPNNQAVRDTLNEECIPQLSANSGSSEFANAVDYPWTTGALTPYDTETKVYADDIAANFPDGSTLGLFYINTEFGQPYADTIEEVAADNGIEIVETQTIEGTDSNPPTAQVNAIAAKQPDVILAVPLGTGCALFLSELANAKAANPGWEPRVYLTSTCTSATVLGLAGAAADGLFSSASGGLIDVGNPEVVAANPKAKEYVDLMTSLGKAEGYIVGGAGWNNAEVTVAVIKQAAESEAGLTRASIIEAARNFTYTPSLGRPGVVYKMNGEEDPFLAEAVQIIQYDATAKIFNDVGELVTSYEH